jgi:hypothetical protein
MYSAAAEDAAVDMVAVAVPLPFATEILPTEHVAAELAAGAMLQVNATPAELNPFDGVMAMLEAADWPDEIEDGDGLDADRLKSAVTFTMLDVLALKLLSPA